MHKNIPNENTFKAIMITMTDYKFSMRYTLTVSPFQLKSTLVHFLRVLRKTMILFECIRICSKKTMQYMFCAAAAIDADDAFLCYRTPSEII